MAEQFKSTGCETVGHRMNCHGERASTGLILGELKEMSVFQLSQPLNVWKMRSDFQGITLLELKQKAVAKVPVRSETEVEVGMAFRDLEQQLVMNMTESELKHVRSAINAFTDLIKK